MTQIVMTLALTAVIMIQGISGEDHTVGDSTGWTNTANIKYSQQAASTRFEVGDKLVFNFQNGSHDVAEVTKEAYDACTTTPPSIIQTSPPVTISLNTNGFHYFICTIGPHCRSGGQKLAVNVVASGSPPAPGTTTTSPGGNSAAAHGVGFSFVLVSLAVALFI